LFGEETDYSIIAGKLRLYTKIPFASGSVEILPQDVLVGAVSGVSIDFTNINNCGANGFISVFGIIKNNNE
jgi:hypothetical protein